MKVIRTHEDMSIENEVVKLDRLPLNYAAAWELFQITEDPETPPIMMQAVLTEIRRRQADAVEAWRRFDETLTD
jgi:hypothetical protein